MAFEVLEGMAPARTGHEAPAEAVLLQRITLPAINPRQCPTATCACAKIGGHQKTVLSLVVSLETNLRGARNRLTIASASAKPSAGCSGFAFAGPSCHVFSQTCLRSAALQSSVRRSLLQLANRKSRL